MILAGDNREADHAARNGLQQARPASAVADMVVTELGLFAREALRSGSAGQVVAVFERSFYAVLDDKWICVGAPEIGSGPLHVLGPRGPSRRLTPGDSVAVVGSALWIEETPFARFDAASVWTPEAAPRWTISSLRTGLHAVDQIWHGDLIEHGLASAGCAEPLDNSPRFVQAAMPGIDALKRIVEGGCERDVRSDPPGLVSLIGLGPGLTPSGDDLIGGALIALAALGRVDLRDLLWEKCCGYLDRTNEISRAHLATAARGYGAVALHTALHATMSGRVEQIYPAIAAVAAIGHTSGRDAFAGALIVLRMLRGSSDPEVDNDRPRGMF